MYPQLKEKKIVLFFFLTLFKCLLEYQFLRNLPSPCHVHMLHNNWKTHNMQQQGSISESSKWRIQLCLRAVILACDVKHDQTSPGIDIWGLSKSIVCSWCSLRGTLVWKYLSQHHHHVPCPPPTNGYFSSQIRTYRCCYSEDFIREIKFIDNNELLR